MARRLFTMDDDLRYFTAAFLLAVYFTCQPNCALADEQSIKVLSPMELDVPNNPNNPEVVNAWYFDGCLTGVAHGYVIGFILARSESNYPKYLKDKVKQFQWPHEFDEIMPNEPKTYEGGAKRYVSSKEELPFRKAGICSTFYASVQEGWKDALNDAQTGFQQQGKKFLQKYVREHPPQLALQIQNVIIWRNQCYFDPTE
jgi:hypothetical protein